MRLLKAMLTLAAGVALAAGAQATSAQAKQAAPPAKKTTEPAKQTAPAKQTPPAKQSPAPTKATQPPAPAPSAPAGGAATTAAQISVSPEMSPGGRRDPFAALISKARTGQRTTPEVVCRAPGKGSIAIDTMRLDGLVRSGEGMIAAVRTPQGRVYFLREGDRLCDGRVSRITMEGLTLVQSSRDAFGRGVDRPVTKRLFPSAGE